MIKLKEKWLWDFWLNKDNDIWYCYFLQADKSLKNPDLRHNNVNHGLATSKDLINWKHHGTVFAPSDNEKQYVVASLKAHSLYFFEYNYNNKENNFNIVKKLDIGERIRDMIYYNEKLYLYLEDTASIAEVSLN